MDNCTGSGTHDTWYRLGPCTDFAELNPVTADLHHVIETLEILDTTFGVGMDKVAGPVPSLAFEGWTRTRGLFGSAKISQHNL
jgi:hypothetical protein